MATTNGETQVPLDPVLLGDEIARTAAHLDAATHRLLTCIRAFDASAEWKRQGALSCAHWLAWRIGLDLGAARERVRVARALGGLPLLDDGLRRGELSYAKVRALTRVATPQNEAVLAEMARSCTGAHLERLCRRLRRVVDVTEAGERLDERRHVKHETLESGMVRITAVLHADEAALVMKAIEEARRETKPRQARDPACSRPRPLQGEPSGKTQKIESATKADAPGEVAAAESRGVSAEISPVISMADALVHMAESYIAGGSQRPGAGSRNQLFIHLDADPVSPDGTFAATLDDGTRISAETWRRLGCDATIVPIHHRGGDTIEGRGARTVSSNQRRALWVRDGGCRFPGCSNRLFVHAHHIRHWVQGGPTTADNLVLLCSSHHRLVHEGGFSMVRLPDGELRFRDPKGEEIEAAPQPLVTRGVGLTGLERVNTQAGLQIDAETGLTRWDGDTIDYEAAIDVLVRGGFAPLDSSGFPCLRAVGSPEVPPAITSRPA